MTTAQKVAQVVANVRAELGRAHRTQGQAAKAIGISGPQMSARMTGAMEFRVNELFALAEWLDVPFSRFLVDTQGTLTNERGDTRLGAASPLAPPPGLEPEPAGYLPAVYPIYFGNPKQGVNVPSLLSDMPLSKVA